MQKVMVISLGGSLIVPAGKINFKLLDEFKTILRRHYRTHKFVVVCGGGSIARKYIDMLRKEGKSERELSLAGIRATRMNALFMMQFFGTEEVNDTLPSDMKDVKNALAKNNAVICGALRYSPKSTSDSTAAKLANYLHTEFINMTNIKGLYTANPLTHKKARFIQFIRWKPFEEMANSKRYGAGQHFVLDQKASTIIRQHRIKTYIIGQDLRNLDKILHSRKFTGTLIYG